ncbi:Crp/Fnr family transcriptional regulator (plasmid) [Streptomyces sp. NBC_01220]|uniref:Crp/Fnr family transcriptional regulator n=1 Tax=Streptomyces sp. NBC_01220 TaxID=2903781 RepID=UPI002F90F874|nr:Crp/Fnr family transcriptional regulator [Streptomyces sp. NBC_01220]
MGRFGEFYAPDRSLMLGGSIYYRDDETGRVRHELSGPRALRSLMELNPFLSQLALGHRQDLFVSGAVRTHFRNQQLRGSSSSMVHIVLGGCVIEEPVYGDAATTRIHGVGAVLGDIEVLNPDVFTPTTRCLNTTVTVSVSLDRMRAIAETNTVLTAVIGKAVTERIAVGERIYNRHALPTEHRLAGLFTYLLEHCSVPSDRYGRMLEGPSQSDLAGALSVSRATIETAVRNLRNTGLLITGYRTYEFPSERKLAELGKVRIPRQMVTGEASETI